MIINWHSGSLVAKPVFLICAFANGPWLVFLVVFVVVVLLCFKTASLYGAQVSVEFEILLLSFQSAGITGLCHTPGLWKTLNVLFLLVLGWRV